MDNKNRPLDDGQQQSSQTGTETGRVKNPFENNQPVEQDIAQSQEEMDKEQQYKEALTERD